MFWPNKIDHSRIVSYYECLCPLLLIHSQCRQHKNNSVPSNSATFVRHTICIFCCYVHKSNELFCGVRLESNSLSVFHAFRFL
jgi:hypothetical protein